MRSINAKKIAAVAGAALLGAGLAFAGPITFQNTTIISNTGQPVVQVVVGSTAAPSDGVAAANIAAAIGNLAYTSVPVTASVNPAQAANVLHVVGSPSYTLSNQQVWLNESGATTATGGTYLFSALIGSVLNQGVQLSSSQYTKNLQSTTSYAFPESPLSTTASPLTSPYAEISGAPTSGSTGTSYTGGVTFSGSQFRLQGGSVYYDNILQISTSQFNMLKTNYGTNGETEYLYLTGFPVYDQQSSVKNFALLNAGGAYEIIFNKPISNTLNSGATQINQPISLLGQNYTIINESGDGSTQVKTGNFVEGGSMYLASSLKALQTVYVGHNITSGPWTVQLQDLGQTSTAYNSPAAIGVYYNGQLTNESSIAPGTTAKFNVSGNLLYLDVNQTFPGLYSYQKWAKLELYNNVFKISSNAKYNQTTNPGWYTDLLWTNTSASSGSGGKSNQLYGIVIYNTTPTTLTPGKSFTFIQDPAAYKVTFIGDTLGTGSYDTVTATTSLSSPFAYANPSGYGTGADLNINNITEPGQLLTVTSQIPSAFSYAGQTSSSVTYDITPYQLNEVANTIARGNVLDASNAVLIYTDPTSTSNTPWLSPNTQLNVNILGFTASNTPATDQATFTYNGLTGHTVTDTSTLATPLYNVTAIQIESSDVLPVYSGGSFGISVNSYNSIQPAGGDNSITLATLNSIQTPGIIYPQSSQSYDAFSNTNNVIYNQQNGGQTTTFTLVTDTSPGSGAGPHPIATYTINEVASTEPLYDQLSFNLDNNSASSPAAYLVNSSTTGQNATYISSTGQSINVNKGFRTERGSEVVSVTSGSDTFSIAKAIDLLQFSVSPNTSNTVVNKAVSTDGPYSIGQATNIANVTVAKIEAKISVSNSSYTIAGINNITATPSVSQATTPVLLKNLSTKPIAVLDSNANPGSTLILVGSGYVNSLSKQLESSYNISVTAASAPIVQAYGTNRILVAGYTAAQTTQAANTFINDLYAAASASS